MTDTNESTPLRRFWRLRLALIVLAILLILSMIPTRFIPAGPLRALHQSLVAARNRGLHRPGNTHGPDPAPRNPGAEEPQFKRSQEKELVQP